MNTGRGCGMHQAAAAAVVESTDIINRSWISAFDTCRNQTFSGDYISKALESQEASLLPASWLAGALFISYTLVSSISWKTFFLLPPSPHTVQWATQKGTHYGTIQRRRHALGGEGCPPLPMFADAREGGVLGLPMSAIFEIIRRQISMLENSTEILFLLWMYLIWNLMRYFCKIKYEKPMEKTFTVFSQIVSSIE